MLKPDQIQYSVNDKRAMEMALVEKSFDLAITQSATSGDWPAYVEDARDGVSQEAVSAVVKKYCEAGWIVDVRPNWRAIIDHPMAKPLPIITNDHPALKTTNQSVASATWQKGILHLTVDGDGLVSLWDAPRTEVSYLRLVLTVDQQEQIHKTMLKDGPTP